MKSYKPELVILSGEEIEDIVRVMEPQDIDLMQGEMSQDDINYLEEKYPELIGVVWTAVAKVVGKIGKGLFGGIARRVRRKRKRKKRAAAARKRKAIRKQQEENYRIMLIQKARKKRQMNIALLALAGAGAFVYMRKR